MSAHLLLSNSFCRGHALDYRQWIEVSSLEISRDNCVQRDGNSQHFHLTVVRKCSAGSAFVPRVLAEEARYDRAECDFKSIIHGTEKRVIRVKAELLHITHQEMAIDETHLLAVEATRFAARAVDVEFLVYDPFGNPIGTVSRFWHPNTHRSSHGI